MASGWRTLYELSRLNGYGIIEAFVCVAAKRLLGTKLYYHPLNERRRIRREREAAKGAT